MSEDDDKELEVDLNQKKVYQLNDKLAFGKFQGETIKHVLDTEPGYLIWLQDNVEHFELKETLLIRAEAIVEQRKHKEREWHYGSGGIHDDFDSFNEDDFC